MHTKEEVDDERAHIKRLVQENKRRLHQLEIQKAQFGARIDPAVIMEIRDIQVELRALSTKSKVLSNIWLCLFGMECIRNDLRNYHTITDKLQKQLGACAPDNDEYREVSAKIQLALKDERDLLYEISGYIKEYNALQ